MTVTPPDLLQALEMVAFHYEEGTLRLYEPAAGWVDDFFKRGTDPLEAFPFLEAFLLEAREHWESKASGCCRSGIWTQKDRNGSERSLAAAATRIAGERALLVWQAHHEHQQRQRVMQALRDNRAAYEELALRGKELERLNRMKSSFIASVSHELRTPLNAILGFSTLLVRGKAGELNPKQASYVSHIHTAATHLLELVNDVLDLSRAEAGTTPLECQWFSFGQLLEEILPVVQPLATTAKIELAAGGDEDLLIYADRLRCKQILNNLLSNAIRFTPKGGRVSITAEQHETTLTFTVADTGVGIPAEEHERIFEPYHQLPQRGGEYPRGTGLGLAIVKKFVEQHGGRVWVESAPGQGSRFRVELPQPPKSAAFVQS
ncbi:MAG: HAMP domain-containing histidine kinase [Bryobacteraceae bacterium]|nr:HAMP domain-containing histidine kinase [Bryobacteraceae bacterium]MDW8376780.1 HAMP domain-containing sensor histidine kinase [Bryobacterales bacterium]